MLRLKPKYAVLVAVTAIVVLLDQLTKSRVIQRFQLGESIAIITGFLNLTYIRNTGAAFGLFAQANPAFRVPFFVIVPIIALMTVSYIFRKIPDGDVKLSAALSLVIGGATGNLIDRLTYGYVIDFIDFHWQLGYHFPAFNVADSAICVGVGILMLDLLIQSDPQSTPQKESSADASIAR